MWQATTHRVSVDRLPCPPTAHLTLLDGLGCDVDTPPIYRCDDDDSMLLLRLAAIPMDLDL